MATIRERLQGYHWLKRKWPRVAKKATWYLMPLELLGLVPCLVIFALAQPDYYRSTMWQIGWDNRLNSNPNMILYAYANYQKLPTVPLIWSQTLTNLNVAISVISLFFILCKLISMIMKVWYPAIAIFANVSLVAIYTVSVYGQVGPDYADPRYPAPAAWYFRFGCDLAKPYGKYGECELAQGSLGATCYMLVIYLLNLGFASYAMKPDPVNDIKEEDDEEDDEDSSQSSEIKTTNVELRGLPMGMGMKSPVTIATSPFTPGVASPFTPGAASPFTPGVASPFTPRSAAFQGIDRKALYSPRRFQ